MAQHDYVIDNSTGATVRADINSVLQAIASNNSGSSDPSTTYAFQLFADTTNNVLKIRNAANNGFINLFTLSGGVDVDAASNFNEDVTFTGASANIVFDKSDNALEFADEAKAKFGTGGDLEIYHDSSTNNSIIRETGSGNLVLHGDMINLSNAAQNESYIRCTPDAQVELYHNNSKKAETVSGGFTVTGTCTATAFSGDGSGLTGVGGTTINNNADNRVITGSGTANTLEGEANLTFNGTKVLLLNTHTTNISDNGFQVNASSNLTDGQFLPALNISPNADNPGRTRAAICGVSHNGTAGMHLVFMTRNAGDGSQLGTSDEKLRIQSGGGISFNGDTAAANALDGYEEGTYTPTFTYSNDDGNKVYSIQTGSYTKIGRLVAVNICIVLSNRGTGSGDVRVTLPFTVADAIGSTSLEASGMCGFFSGLSSSISTINLVPTHNNTDAALFGLLGSSSTAVSAFTYAFLGNSSSFRFSLVYFTST